MKGLFDRVFNQLQKAPELDVFEAFIERCNQADELFRIGVSDKTGTSIRNLC